MMQMLAHCSQWRRTSVAKDMEKIKVLLCFFWLRLYWPVHRPPSSLKLTAECQAATLEEIRIKELITFPDKMEDKGRTVYVSLC